MCGECTAISQEGLFLVTSGRNEEAVRHCCNRLIDASALHFTDHSMPFFSPLISWYRMTVGF
jgi:hypothetical protein